eukprot:4755249-Pyramimonas_sp.AAC.1
MSRAFQKLDLHEYHAILVDLHDHVASIQRRDMANRSKEWRERAQEAAAKSGGQKACRFIKDGGRIPST